MDGFPHLTGSDAGFSVVSGVSPHHSTASLHDTLIPSATVSMESRAVANKSREQTGGDSNAASRGGGRGANAGDTGRCPACFVTSGEHPTWAIHGLGLVFCSAHVLGQMG